ncbi:MAG: hypothetical protein LC725_05105, partial [Lentisphaerae bacterium]|nr:hypothetical protein [Lentisphaerota bacterium]
MTAIATENTQLAGGWRASLQPWPEAQTNFLVVEGRNLQVRFADAAAWTIFDMHWRGREVGRHSGATGSVIQWQEDAPRRSVDDIPDRPCCKRYGGPLRQTIGTGHGGEIVRRITVYAESEPPDPTAHRHPCDINPREIPIVAEGELVAETNRSVDGTRIRVRKESIIGPFDHEATFDFSSAFPGFAVTHRFRANAAMARGHFAGYRYTFMFMLPETYDRYLIVNGDDRTEQAIITPAAGKLLNQSFRALACISPTDQTGIAYVYPEAYPGSNHINVRPGKDRKFRADLFRDHYEVGEVSEFNLRIIPFEAQEH